MKPMDALPFDDGAIPFFPVRDCWQRVVTAAGFDLTGITVRRHGRGPGERSGRDGGGDGRATGGGGEGDRRRRSGEPVGAGKRTRGEGRVHIDVFATPEAGERLRQVLSETPGGRGADVVLECAGVPSAVAEGFEMARRNAKVPRPWPIHRPRHDADQPARDHAQATEGLRLLGVCGGPLPRLRPIAAQAGRPVRPGAVPDAVPAAGGEPGAGRRRRRQSDEGGLARCGSGVAVVSPTEKENGLRAAPERRADRRCRFLLNSDAAAVPERGIRVAAEDLGAGRTAALNGAFGEAGIAADRGGRADLARVLTAAESLPAAPELAPAAGAHIVVVGAAVAAPAAVEDTPGRDTGARRTRFAESRQPPEQHSDPPTAPAHR